VQPLRLQPPTDAVRPPPTPRERRPTPPPRTTTPRPRQPTRPGDRRPDPPIATGCIATVVTTRVRPTASCGFKARYHPSPPRYRAHRAALPCPPRVTTVPLCALTAIATAAPIKVSIFLLIINFRSVFFELDIDSIYWLNWFWVRRCPTFGNFDLFCNDYIFFWHIERPGSESGGVRPSAILIYFLMIIYSFDILNALVLSPEVSDLRQFWFIF